MVTFTAKQGSRAVSNCEDEELNKPLRDLSAKELIAHAHSSEYTPTCDELSIDSKAAPPVLKRR